MPKLDPKANKSASPNRHLVLVGDGHDKFWKGELDGTSYTTFWGKNGTAGQSKTFTAKSADAALGELPRARSRCMPATTSSKITSTEMLPRRASIIPRASRSTAHTTSSSVTTI